jgi:hypothetical protein
MPFALMAIGLLLVIAAYNNTQTVLASQLKKDFSGNTGFIYWIAAIMIVGAIGYIKPMQTVSRAMLALVLVVIFLTNSGVFSKFNSALSGSDAVPNGDAKVGSGTGGAENSTGNASGEHQPLIIDLFKSPTLGGMQ